MANYPTGDPRAQIKAAIDAGDLKWLLEKAGELHGHYCPGLAYGIRSGYKAVTELGAHSTGMEEVVAIVESNNCFADGIQFVTGCSFANNALIFRDLGKTAVTLARRSGEGVRVLVDMDRQSLQEREPEAMALFQKVVAERKGSEEDSAHLRELWRQASFNMLNVPENELLKVQNVTVELPSYAGIFASVTCSKCGESVMEPRIRMRNGQPVCLPCSGQEYYQLDGNGIRVICT
ncbi:MAG: FmdE family protein [Dehalococcoidia bacterium]